MTFQFSLDHLILLLLVCGLSVTGICNSNGNGNGDGDSNSNINSNFYVIDFTMLAAQRQNSQNQEITNFKLKN